MTVTIQSGILNGIFASQPPEAAVNAWRSPERVLDAHPPGQNAQPLYPSAAALLVRTISNESKAGPMPTYERLGTDNREDLQDRWKPAIYLDKDTGDRCPLTGAATDSTPQGSQLISQGRVLCLKPQLRLEQRIHKGDRRNRTRAVIMH
jgi:hypothetical protein